jgi:hypothetical protein
MRKLRADPFYTHTSAPALQRAAIDLGDPYAMRRRFFTKQLFEEAIGTTEIQVNFVMTLLLMGTSAVTRFLGAWSLYGGVHTALHIGQWIIEWDHRSLIIPHLLEGCFAHQLPIISIRACTIDANDRKRLLRLCKYLTDWNRHKEYSLRKLNCQHFVNSFFETVLSSIPTFDGAVAKYLQRISKEGPKSEKQFRDKISFLTHRELDDYVIEALQTPGNLKDDEISLLRSFDAAFHLRYHDLRGGHVLQEEFGPSPRGCPFHMDCFICARAGRDEENNIKDNNNNNDNDHNHNHTQNNHNYNHTTHNNHNNHNNNDSIPTTNNNNNYNQKQNQNHTHSTNNYSSLTNNTSPPQGRIQIGNRRQTFIGQIINEPKAKDGQQQQ